MTLAELKRALEIILAEEERRPTDWARVEAMCLEVIERLITEPEPPYPHDVVYHFLDDPDVRRKSARYAHGQRQRVRDWLFTPEQEGLASPHVQFGASGDLL